MEEPEHQKKPRITSDEAKAVLIKTVIELFQTIPIDEITTRRISEHAGFDTKTIFRNFENLEGLYIAALKVLEARLIREGPHNQFSPVPSTQLYLRFFTWLVLSGIPPEKLAAGNDFASEFRAVSYERIGVSPDLSERAKQAFLNLAGSFLHSQVDLLSRQPNVFPPDSLVDSQVLLDAIMRHMPAFAQELGWED